MKTALICGVSGQSYRGVGTSRDAQSGRDHCFAVLGVEEPVSVEFSAGAKNTAFAKSAFAWTVRYSVDDRVRNACKSESERHRR